MVRARRAFLQRQHYRALAAAVAQTVRSRAVKPRVVVDVGCGEGYYLGILAADPALAGAAFHGTDISRAAVASASQAHPAASFAVADTNTLIPLADAGVDVLVNIFAPRNAPEFARVVRPGGRAVIAVPGNGHLASLRERFRLLAIEDDKAQKIAGQLAGFALTGVRAVTEVIELDGPALRDLLEMTPNARHMDDATRRELDAVTTMETRTEFEVLEFTRLGL